MMQLLDAGRTRIHTRREKARLITAAVLVLASAAVSFGPALSLVSWVQGHPQPEIHTQPVFTGGGLLTGGHFQPPLYLVYDDPWWPGVLTLTLTVTAAVFAFLSRWPGRRRDPRERHLARWKDIRREYSARAARKAGAYTLPDHTRRNRRRLPTRAFALHLGKVTRPKGGQVWVSPENRIRIIARPGWGKTFRLLIPMIRTSTGPALISSVEPDIFLSTVRARQFRWPDGRRRRLPERVHTFKGTRWQRPQPDEYPVFVVECMPDANKVAVGYPSVRWDPIAGSDRYATALRRAKAIVKGLDEGNDDESAGTARWFENVVADVIAAWLHALAFRPRLPLSEMDKWLRTKDIATPRGILDAESRRNDLVNPAAMTNLSKHLAEEGGKTTANVYTFLARAIASLTGEEGRAVIADRGEPDQFDPTQLVRDKGTLYLLAEDEQMATVRPLLSLLAAEVARAGEQVARSRPGAKRLPEALMLFLDELRRGVRLADLPRISQTARKFGISYVYACTNGGDEKALYGEDDAAVLKSASLSVYGGYDEKSAQEVTDIAGRRPVVTASSSAKMGHGQSENLVDVLDKADLQNLAAGEAVVIAPGLPPFVVFCRSIYQQRRVRRRIAREKAQVRADG